VPFEANAGNILKLLYNRSAVEDQDSNWGVLEEEPKSIGRDSQKRGALSRREFSPLACRRIWNEVEVAGTTRRAIERCLGTGNDVIQSLEPPVVWIPKKVRAARFQNQTKMTSINLRPGGKAKRIERVKPAKRPLKLVTKFVHELSITRIEP
jgi:hypothetical protein